MNKLSLQSRTKLERKDISIQVKWMKAFDFYLKYIKYIVVGTCEEFNSTEAIQETP